MKDDINVELIIEFGGESPELRNLLNYDKLAKRVDQRDEIISLVQKLDWTLPEDVQEKAINTLIDTVHEDDYDLLIIAGHKFTWPNTIRVLNMAGYPKNKKALPSLFLLFQDLNWPGALEGMHVLIESDKGTLIPLLEIAIKSAFFSKDYIWLAGIKQFVEFAKISKSDFVNSNVYDLLEHAE